ncbi:TetR/AcrR family transcriptional regulator [Williamsia soli]|uniref:TetR/AcrR family transcriptional regulator n=1 Tax=Williamsia soli TaxID=364929 RepID=UPI001A9D5220|nr:TetR/AcrR family transcriptional regulator [Williamsia soli]
MAPSTRRVGAQTSKTRDAILDCVEKLMIREGYPSVTYRVLAAEAGVTPSLVQYYFPTLDAIFVSALQRRTAENVQRLRDALANRPDEILHVMWEFSRREATGALVTEFMALGNHRKTVGVEIARVTEEIRQVQIEALRAHESASTAVEKSLSAGALVALISGVPKMLSLEKGVGITTAHDDVVSAFESYIDTVEPLKPKARRTD